MGRSSVFSLCSLATCVRRVLLISVALSLVYLLLSTLVTVPSNWRTPSIQSSTQMLGSGSAKSKNGPKQDVNQRRLNRPQHPAANKSSLLNGAVMRVAEWDFVPEDAADHTLLETAAAQLGPNEVDQSHLCPELEQNAMLRGHLGQATLLIEELEEAEVEAAYPELEPGGRWKPHNCTARHKIAVVIPYRDRKTHLVRLLDFLIPILQRQQLDFRFIVTEQAGEDLFNKGRIMNAAFRFGQSQGLDCVIFHDVDMFPQDDRTPYGCPSGDGPQHVGAFVSNLGYQLWYNEIVGGVLAINVADYERVNGFSNSYWAWGGEDDDMGKRILSHNFTIERPNADFVRFSMLKHPKRKRLAPKLVYKLLEEAEKRMDVDGVAERDKWTILKKTVRPLYFHLLVDVGEPPSEWKASS